MKEVILRKKKKNAKSNLIVEFSNEILEIPYEETTNEKCIKKYTEKSTRKNTKKNNNKSTNENTNKSANENANESINENALQNGFNSTIYKNKYFLQFIISSIIATIFILILIYQIYKLKQNEKISKELLNNYSLTSLYQREENVTIEKQSVLIENPFVIGIIKISKIGLNYPIISETNSDLLKISLCRFSGPMPNEYGNLCIVGHNFVDNKFFSNLYKLENGDIVEIYDLFGNKINYSVFNKFEVKANDLSCIDQNVNNERIITLITCNNLNGKRTVIKAKEII